MNPNEFETRLQRIPLKQPPEAWREEILTAAAHAAEDVRRRVEPVGELTFAAAWQRRLRELLWPHPAAWGAIAAAWLAIIALNLESRAGSPAVAVSAAPPSEETFELAREQRRELAAMLEPVAASEPAPAHRTAPQSRIDRRRDFLAA